MHTIFTFGRRSQIRVNFDSEAIELLLKEGHVVICSGGGGVPVTEDGAGGSGD